jgi:membrane-associated phospholipid phosphatase
MNQGWSSRLLELDLAWSRRLQSSSQAGILRRLEILLAHSGDSWFVLLALALSWWLGNSDWKTLSMALAIGVALTALMVFLLKYAVRRPRPAGEWGNIYRKTDPHSFPSGHAARAVMMTVVALGLGPPWLGIGLAVWALFVCLSRVILGVHFLSDILAGSLLGAVIGLGIILFA